MLCAAASRLALRPIATSIEQLGACADERGCIQRLKEKGAAQPLFQRMETDFKKNVLLERRSGSCSAVAIARCVYLAHRGAVLEPVERTGSASLSTEPVSVARA